MCTWHWKDMVGFFHSLNSSCYKHLKHLGLTSPSAGVERQFSIPATSHTAVQMTSGHSWHRNPSPPPLTPSPCLSRLERLGNFSRKIRTFQQTSSFPAALQTECSFTCTQNLNSALKSPNCYVRICNLGIKPCLQRTPAWSLSSKPLGIKRNYWIPKGRDLNVGSLQLPDYIISSLVFPFTLSHLKNSFPDSLFPPL